jgi:hypothetical protein
VTAVSIWVRADLRRRWRSWVVLGLLTGVSIGLACAGVAGARRTHNAPRQYARVAHVPDAAILPNDPAFDTRKQAQVAAVPDVAALHPFVVPFLLHVTKPQGIDPTLLPITPAAMQSIQNPIVAGRAPDPMRADEGVVNEQARDALGLDVGSTLTLVQEPPSDDFPFPAPPGSARPIHQVVRVVGVMDGAGSDGPDWAISSGFYAKYQDQVVGPTNAMVDLRHGVADLDQLRRDADRLMGKPVNVENGEDLFGVRQILNVSDVEATGLMLFALAVLVGAGALVGQALVRAVSAGAADIETWRAIGADRRLATRAMVVPVVLVVAVGALSTIVVAVALSPRFPIALTRQFDLDPGYHADWTVLGAGVLCLAVATLATAWAASEIRLRRDGSRDTGRASRLTATGLPPALMVGSRLATESGRGHRAVPVRSALVGAVVGVLGVVGCLTFRGGLSDTVADPSRSGVVWDHVFAKAGLLTDEELARTADDRVVAASLHATWARALSIDGTSTPTFGVAERGPIGLEVLAGRAPARRDEIAFAPTTMNVLDVRIGDQVTVGASKRHMRVVGRVLLPATSHTDYDQGASMTRDALLANVPAGLEPGDDFYEDYHLLRWKPGADVSGLRRRLDAIAERGDGLYSSQPAELPPAVESLRDLRVLPLSLAVFFALLAIATVAHALVTTVRRRRIDLAILRSIGFTRRETRLAIAWQSTLLATVGVAVGLPVGIIVGQALWKQLAESFPVVYVPPLALVAILLVVPAALAIANALAVGPARSATRVRPANVLRSE